MEKHTTSAAPSKSPAPSPNNDSGPSAFSQCDDASCAFERLMVLLSTITELQRCASDDLPHGETRDRAHFEVFCLLLLLNENMEVHSAALDRIQRSIVEERTAA